jgi:hypothetical protein
MPQPRPRHDQYGRPLPTLAPAASPPAPQAVLHSETNTAMRRQLLWLLEHEYQDLFQCGMFAEVTLTLRVVDGTLQAEVDVEVKRLHRLDPGERNAYSR